jgi:hypothetical protein
MFLFSNTFFLDIAWDVFKFSQVLKASHKYNKNFIEKKSTHHESKQSIYMYLLNNARNDQQRDENKKY